MQGMAAIRNSSSFSADHFAAPPLVEGQGKQQSSSVVHHSTSSSHDHDASALIHKLMKEIETLKQEIASTKQSESNDNFSQHASSTSIRPRGKLLTEFPDGAPSKKDIFDYITVVMPQNLRRMLYDLFTAFHELKELR